MQIPPLPLGPGRHFYNISTQVKKSHNPRARPETLRHPIIRKSVLAGLSFAGAGQVSPPRREPLSHHHLRSVDQTVPLPTSPATHPNTAQEHPPRLAFRPSTHSPAASIHAVAARNHHACTFETKTDPLGSTTPLCTCQLWTTTTRSLERRYPP